MAEARAPRRDSDASGLAVRAMRQWFDTDDPIRPIQWTDERLIVDLGTSLECTITASSAGWTSEVVDYRQSRSRRIPELTGPIDDLDELPEAVLLHFARKVWDYAESTRARDTELATDLYRFTARLALWVSAQDERPERSSR